MYARIADRKSILEVLEGVLKALGTVLEAEMSQDSQERARNKIRRKFPSGLESPRTHPGALGGILEVLGRVLEALEGISEALGGVLESLGGVLETKDSTKMGQERAKSKVPRKLQSGLKPPRRILEALGGVLEVLKALERVLEASWRRFGGVLEVLESVLEALGGVLETKMSQDSQERAKGKIPRELPSGLSPQDASWRSWGHLRSSWARLGGS